MPCAETKTGRPQTTRRQLTDHHLPVTTAFAILFAVVERHAARACEALDDYLR
ncbi:hypothetical protein [Streptomyces sp. NBC_00076]|uniref:hypothetical protein n=1 Tax=Streptomyces sp. NBC_00076 TaxID=2975642 RepID=UPI00324D1597